MKKVISVILCLLLLSAVLCGCGGSSDSGFSVDVKTDSPSYGGAGSTPSGSGSFESYSGGSAGGDSAAKPGAELEPAMAPDVDDGFIIEPDYPGEPAPEPQAGLLTAAEWNDNDNFGFFTEVLNFAGWKSMQDIWRLYPINRVAVTVTEPGTDKPVEGAAVALTAGQEIIAEAVTDYSGRAYLYYNLRGADDKVPDGVTAEIGGVKTDCALAQGETSAALTLENSLQKEKTLDLMFMIDTTGSMGDELEYLKAELRDIIRRASDANGGMKIRLSVNFYRDEGDQYLVRPFEFTEDIDAAIKNLSAQYSDGGGDIPEAVDAAFYNAVNEHEWDEGAVKLLFFVLDAPPHSDSQSAPTTMRECMEMSAKMGIRVIPVVCSGDSPETEFLMRAAAAVSGGTYTFLTDDSGIGNSHLEPTVGEYQVEQFNALILRLINKYCA